MVHPSNRGLSVFSAYLNPIAIFTTAFLLVLYWSSRYSETAALYGEAASYFSAGLGILDGIQNRMLADINGATFSDIGYPNFLSIGFLVLVPSIKNAQILNGVLWGISSVISYLLFKEALPTKKAFICSLVLATSPALTSFSGRIYSEHLAICGGLLCLLGFLKHFRRKKFLFKVNGLAFAAAVIGGLILSLTKSSFFFLFVLLLAVSLFRKERFTIAVSAFIIAALLPVQSHLHRGARGAIQVAAQTAKLELQTYPIVLKCSFYNLSLQLGKKLFPEVEAPCRPNLAGTDFSHKELGYEAIALKKVQAGFSYRDGLNLILRSPIKYAFIGLATLFTAFWIEGFYPDPISDLSENARRALWVFKVIFSTFLWIGALMFFVRSWRTKENHELALLLSIPIAFVLLFQMNVPAEQRYFFPLIPILYLACGIFLSSALSRAKDRLSEPFEPLTSPILGIPISTLDLENAVSFCAEHSKQNRGGYVCFTNVHLVTESQTNLVLKNVLSSALLSLADGIPLVWVSRLKRRPIKSRVCGPDFMKLFIEQHGDIGSGFMGGAIGSGEKIAARFKLDSVSYSPPMRPYSRENAIDDWTNFLKKAGKGPLPKVVWVGLGAPKQELWMKTVSEVAPNVLFFGVGAAFDFLTGRKERAPFWMQRCGLEWFYRLCQEPVRLWKRYLITNTRFVAYLVREALS